MTASNVSSANVSSDNLRDAQFSLLIVRNDDAGVQRRLTMEAFAKRYDEYMSRKGTDSEQIAAKVKEFFDENPGINISKSALLSNVLQMLGVTGAAFGPYLKVVDAWLKEHTTKEPKVLVDAEGTPILNDKGKKQCDPNCFYSTRGNGAGVRRWCDIPLADQKKLVEKAALAAQKHKLLADAGLVGKKGKGADADTDESDDDSDEL